MDSTIKAMKKNPLVYSGVGLMTLFIATGMKPSVEIAKIVNNTIGKMTLIILSLSLFYVHHILGAVGLVFTYELIKRSENIHSTPNNYISTYLPSEFKKGQIFTAMNQFPVTLEEEMVEKLVPISRKNLGEPEFRPVMDKIHDAAKLN